MHHNKIALLRKSWELSQPELAALLGVSRSAAARLESGRLPVVMTALTLEVLFDVPVCDLFPRHYAKAVEALAARLAEFSVLIEDKTDAKSEQKKLLLSDFTSRAHTLPI